MKRVRDPGEFREAIDARTLTRREVGRLAGCTVGTVQFILNGQATDPALARRLARVLRRPVDELFVDVPSSNKQTTVERKAIA